ncbi:MAG: hypothetical protein ACOCV2_03825 [Persicimonas sp.]
MTRFCLLVAVALLTACTVSCETSKAERTGPDAPHEEASALTDSESADLRERAERARDRTFEETPSIVSVDDAGKLPDGKKSPEEVRAERTLLVEKLFGEEQGLEDLDRRTRPMNAIAAADPERERVLYVKDHSDRGELESAIVAQLVLLLDKQHGDADPKPESWDHELALQTARNATVSTALAADQLERDEHSLDLAGLAKRPEVAQRLPVLGPRLEPPAQSGEISLSDRISAFTMREGWTLGAALYRSSGWSGVELAYLEPPERTSDVVRPDHWMKGEPVGKWQWPNEEEQRAEKSGAVGPGLMTIWLEETVGPALARTMYAGYTSDAYRYFEADDNDSDRFEWLTLWNSPDSAKQVVQAFEMRLRKRFEDTDHPDEHYVVFRKGLNVGVIIAQMDEDERRDRARKLLDQHETQLAPRDGLPASFVETRQDELNEQMLEAQLDDRVWTDPSTNLRLDLNSLGDAWTVREPDQGPVRWFAQHDDGAMLQLTAELDDPLGPDFDTKAYRDQLVDSFQGSLGDAKVDEVNSTQETPGEGLVIHLAGVMNNQPRELRMWQYRRGDLVISFSLQAPADSFADHRETAESLLENFEPLEDEQDDAPSEKTDSDSGVIEYEVEDEPDEK